MDVRAKFVVRKKLEESTGETDATLAQVTLNAVTSEGNEDWSQFTPAGEITMTIRNKAAADQFVVGRNMILTFRAEAGSPGAGRAGEIGKAGHGMASFGDEGSGDESDIASDVRQELRDTVAETTALDDQDGQDHERAVA